eukprot:TRINITY_DN243_c0_g1_i1.p1 TRINITY_DN243_c0_g1~~TRINITY_DN243_c0_g1_i1.p1  ORF type:complete len:465 (-),score=105.43 TRINITY_DN243_c0_g1_i1:16-1365(-)
MAPRRGGGGGAGLEVAGAGSSVRAGLAPPPLKRLQPWHQDGSSQCDIIAGGVDASGIFKGIYVSGVGLAALLRTFQLSKVFLPVESETPVQALGQSLSDGIPLVIVTRGCFGRAMDYGNGPSRNEIQKAVWEAARSMRADMPQVMVTCIDIPVDCPAEVVNACFQSPLNEYRELMYHDGTWYTPAVYNSSKLAQFMANNERQGGNKGGISFSRKRFEWNTKPYENSFILGWKQVLEVKPAADIPVRTDLVFTGDSSIKQLADQKPSIPPRGPSSAEVTFQKMMRQARESGSNGQYGDPVAALEAAKLYIPRAAFREKTSLREAYEVCKECSASAGDAEAQFRAKLLATGAKIVLYEVEEALKEVQSIKQDAPTPATKVEALEREVDCLAELGELEKAVAAAREGKATLGPEVADRVNKVLAKALAAIGEEADSTVAGAIKAHADGDDDA